MKHTKALISILILVTSLFGQTTDGKTAPPMKFQDINANYPGFQVSNIETTYARAKAHGAITVSEGGINKGKAALIRDPDVGGYIMLWQPAR